MIFFQALKMKNNKLKILIISLLCMLVSCSFNKKNSVSLPKVNNTASPGGSELNWRYLGMNEKRNISLEIDDNSIKSYSINNDNYLNESQNIRNSLLTFTDRKTFFDSNLLVNNKIYKYVISSWVVDCLNEEYLIQDANFYNNKGESLAFYNFREDNSQNWYKVGNDSFSKLQYNYVCFDINRQLGY